VTESDAQILKTLIHYLIASKHTEAAAAIIDGEICCSRDGYFSHEGDIIRCYLDIPPGAYPLVASNVELQAILRRALREVLNGHAATEFEVELRMKQLPVEEGWETIARNMIVNARGTNQGLVSQICASRNGRPIHTWNELRYATAGEIAIAQEFERRKILFFPLPVAVRAETGINWKDHREVDFLICHNGAWGNLEVSYHPDRYEKDSEKDLWFNKSGITCIKHFTTERAQSEPAKVVDEFLSVLKHFEK
jgi:hypothetical protein